MAGAVGQRAGKRVLMEETGTPFISGLWSAMTYGSGTGSRVWFDIARNMADLPKNDPASEPCRFDGAGV